jgi:hypothetical protein
MVGRTVGSESVGGVGVQAGGRATPIGVGVAAGVSGAGDAPKGSVQAETSSNQGMNVRRFMPPLDSI